MNLEIGAEAGQFPEKEYINGIFVAILWAKVFLLFGDFHGLDLLYKLFAYF
jgi:hypothetical protein